MREEGTEGRLRAKSGSDLVQDQPRHMPALTIVPNTTRTVLNAPATTVHACDVI